MLGAGILFLRKKRDKEMRILKIKKNKRKNKDTTFF
tara:strand:+ start:36347 stop:36454 length:108 start_codon:yes stop_codon:yes gene_type:complete